MQHGRFLFALSWDSQSLHKQHGRKVQADWEPWRGNINSELKKEKKIKVLFSFLKPDNHFHVNVLEPFKTWTEDLMWYFVIARTFINNV